MDYIRNSSKDSFWKPFMDSFKIKKKNEIKNSFRNSFKTFLRNFTWDALKILQGFIKNSFKAFSTNNFRHIFRNCLKDKNSSKDSFRKVSIYFFEIAFLRISFRKYSRYFSIKSSKHSSINIFMDSFRNSCKGSFKKKKKDSFRNSSKLFFRNSSSEFFWNSFRSFLRNCCRNCSRRKVFRHFYKDASRNSYTNSYKDSSKISFISHYRDTFGNPPEDPMRNSSRDSFKKVFHNFLPKSHHAFPSEGTPSIPS